VTLSPKLSSALIAATAALIALMVLLLLLGGPSNFHQLVRGAAPHIAVISATAGSAGVIVSRAGRGIALLSGIIIAASGYAIILFYALSRI
jgi:hypothetical protein